MDTKNRCLLSILVLHRVKKRKSELKRRYWIHPINQNRPLFGEFHQLFQELKADDERFMQYTRMSVNSFEQLLMAIRPAIEEFGIRTPVTAEERLLVTLIT